MVTGKAIRQGILLLILLMAAAAVAWHFWMKREDDETGIRRILSEVTENITKRDSDGTTSNLINSKALPKYFTSPCGISLGGYIDNGYLDSEGITNHSMRIRTMFRSITPTIKDLYIEVAPGGETAVADFVASVRGVLNNGEHEGGVRDLRCNFVKVDGRWKVSAVSIRDVLER
jgi:hypothetical protein